MAGSISNIGILGAPKLIERQILQSNIWEPGWISGIWCVTGLAGGGR
jgi:hypothetical protein